MRFPLISFGILVTFTILLITDGAFEANFKKVECDIRDKSVFVNFSCSAKPINRRKTIVNLSGYLARRLDKMTLHLQMFKKFNVVYRSFLLNVTEDFCQRFEKKVNAPYLNILHSIAERFTNLNHTCPYEGWLTFKDFELDLNNLKVLLPDGEYRLDIGPTINEGPSPSFVLHFFFEYVTKFR